MRIEHVASCPEDNPVRCAEEPIEPYRHDQRITWFRADLGAWVGLGQGWQVGGSLPFDVRALRIDYTTLDGKPYDLPWANIHHRDETLWGPTDGRAMVQYFRRVERTTVGGGLGSTLPFGHTEEDPFALTEEGLEHQHFQMGSGTFDPVASAWITTPITGKWGLLGFANARVPLYANRHGYSPPASAQVGFGPTFNPAPKLQLQGTVEGLMESAEQWSGEGHGGRQAVNGSLGAAWAFAPAWVLQAQARTTLWQTAMDHGGDEQLRQRFVGTVGASWTPPRHNEVPEAAE